MGEFKKPNELTDEDTWLGLTKIKLLYLLIGIALIFVAFKMLAPIGWFLLDGMITTIIIAVEVVIIKIPIPEDYYLSGGGYSTDVILLRMLLSIRNKKICVRNLEESRNEYDAAN